MNGGKLLNDARAAARHHGDADENQHTAADHVSYVLRSACAAINAIRNAGARFRGPTKESLRFQPWKNSAMPATMSTIPRIVFIQRLLGVV